MPYGEETRTARDAREVLTWARGLLEPGLREVVERLPAATRHVAGYHFGWWDERGRPGDGDGGKAIRPALVLLAAEAVGGTAEKAVPAAVAVELVHNFSLLHDDAMDGDVMRRHRRTAWSVFGLNPAILTGDALLIQGFAVLAATGHPAARDGVATLSTAVRELVDGQTADMSFETRSDVDLDECVRMAGEKTGALIGCACGLGASFGGGTADQVARLTGFGTRLGLAFQLVDDLLGIWGDPEVTGKPVYSDLRNRKKSLPVVFALTSGTDAGKELAAAYHRVNPLADPELRHVAALVEAAGGRAWAQAEADRLLREAMGDLADAVPSPGPAADLATLARLITQRTS
ncbi:family 2 encapsulin nanocompartment cargo protein polyprenyl transferase [Bailinhaonella thermotolerans]|uniref:Polyprenyl synthetase family protein n=1 Tax=Bailinhaonella thermotolerans TaxID=1070861 RepID=A0A3A4B0T6_9ACTN|nr:family 2 encapsulin nanocompartment cargo protein polyprenyl transferase [Bailinhaonella thermotolerans]RJL31637.1 polyprenyl synthetase family protein [Bailinhaonella thermotolerans]